MAFTQVYVCKISDFQAKGNQIDIPKKVAISFFGIPENVITNEDNFTVSVCHYNDTNSVVPIEIQSSTNPRWSLKLNSFLDNCGTPLHSNDLLVFEKLGRIFCIHPISADDNNHVALSELLSKSEKHILLSGSFESQPESTEEINGFYRRYIAAIKSKPFLLLAGISGTGKSRIVRELARACWEVGSKEYEDHKPRNFEMVQVKPNWHDSSELIGYVSRIDGEKFVAGDFLKFVAKAWEEPGVPYFLCLDEMNLAPVEQYFAEYLSVVESRKNKDGVVVTDPLLKKSKDDWYRVLTSELTEDDELRTQFLNDGICIPPNLIVVGTVNMDETTFSFSRKVLDRAMTIEMNEVDLKGGLSHRHEQIGKLGNAELVGNAVEGVDIYEAHKDVCDKVIEYLQAVNDKLEGTPFKIAYRTRNEFLLYVVNNLPYNKDKTGSDLAQDFVIARALDEITNMKILSRIEGDETKVNDLFHHDALKKTVADALHAVCEEYKTEEAVSIKKLDEMKKKLDGGYTSFWS